jgi:hypothetical protein
MAWLVLLEVGGSYEAFEEQIQASLLEMIRNLNVVNEAWIQHELQAAPVSTGSPGDVDATSRPTLPTPIPAP